MRILRLVFRRDTKILTYLYLSDPELLQCSCHVMLIDTDNRDMYADVKLVPTESRSGCWATSVANEFRTWTIA